MRVALGEMYAYYRRAGGMLAHVVRDAATMPHVADAVEQNFGGYIRSAVNVLASSLGPASGSSRSVTAALSIALDFRTWEMLTKQSGLDTESAADLMAVLIEGAGRRGKSKR